MLKAKTREAIAVMEAYLEGAEIQVRARSQQIWVRIAPEAGESPHWCWDVCDYRVAPSPPQEVPLKLPLFGVVDNQGNLQVRMIYHARSFAERQASEINDSPGVLDAFKPYRVVELTEKPPTA